MNILRTTITPNILRQQGGAGELNCERHGDLFLLSLKRILLARHERRDEKKWKMMSSHANCYVQAPAAAGG